MIPIADGSDTGGSLRNPAAFCNVAGFRPSPGRVHTGASTWSPLSVSGPMGRTVADAKQRPKWIKDTIHWEIREAERQTAVDVARATARQAKAYADSQQFFSRYEYFVLPVTQVMPFDVNIAYPTSVAGTPMSTYIDWMRSCWYITFMANPAISVPAGFSSAGLPVGLQIVGRHRADWSVLQLAHAFEQATGHAKKRPF
jgi:amidase